MQIRETSLAKIADHLARIRHQVSLRNSIQLFDINIHSEEFFKELLNRMFGYQLENLNSDYGLSESIDLGDEINGIAVQVTSDKSKKKLTSTVRSFVDNGTNRDYPILKILLLGEKSKRYGNINYHGFQFDMNADVIDFPELLKSIRNLETSKITEIEQWMASELHSNIKFGSYIPPTNSDFDRYFRKFLSDEVDSDLLLFKAQPSLADCREVFSDEYYLLVHQIYSVFYFSMLSNARVMNNKLRDKEIFRSKTSNLKDIESKNHELPRGMSEIVEALRPGKLQYHSISFTAKEQERGLSFSIWTFLNGRWVFFPKPWELIFGIRELKDHPGLKTVTRVMRFFGMRINGPKDQARTFAALVLFSELTKKNY
jgi:hypothetical protein